jgi:multiple sugar transport system permease protein
MLANPATKRQDQWVKATTSGLMALLYVLLSVIAIANIIPFLWMLASSFKERGDVFSYPPSFIPNPFVMDAYERLFTQIPFVRQFLNTLFIAGTVTLGQLFFCSMSAYAFARIEFPGRDTLFVLVLATMMIPGQVTLIPSFVLMRLFGWVDSYNALILPPLFFSAFGIFLLRQFFMTIPVDLGDAAVIDGAGYFRTYWQVMLPLTRQSLATFGLFTFMWHWNNFLWPLIVMNSRDKMPLTVGLAFLTQGPFGRIDWPELMAGSTFSILPILALFVFLQRYFVEGIVLTGIKG